MATSNKNTTKKITNEEQEEKIEDKNVVEKQEVVKEETPKTTRISANRFKKTNTYNLDPKREVQTYIVWDPANY